MLSLLQWTYEQGNTFGITPINTDTCGGALGS